MWCKQISILLNLKGHGQWVINSVSTDTKIAINVSVTKPDEQACC